MPCTRVVIAAGGAACGSSQRAIAPSTLDEACDAPSIAWQWSLGAVDATLTTRHSDAEGSGLDSFYVGIMAVLDCAHDSHDSITDGVHRFSCCRLCVSIPRFIRRPNRAALLPFVRVRIVRVFFSIALLIIVCVVDVVT